MLVKHGCFQLLVWEADGTVRWDFCTITLYKNKYRVKQFCYEGEEVEKLVSQKLCEMNWDFFQ